MTSSPSRTLAIGFAGLGLVGALAGCSAGTSGTAGSGSGGAADPSSGSTSSDAGSSAAAGSYNDGSYTESGSYLSPAGEESVTVTVTLAANKVTAVTVVPKATDPTAKGYQQMFAGGIASVVVGKDLDSLNVSRVAGSSLTSGGFNKAIAAIKTDAATA